MGFSTTNLTGNRVLVTGTDVRGTSGEVVVDSTQWLSIKRKGTYEEALASVDAAIAALVAPIQEAVDAANAKLKLPEMDPLLYVVEQDEVEHQQGRPMVTTKLNHDSVILRAIETGQADRLIWVGGTLELTAAPAPVVVPELVPDEPADLGEPTV